MAEQKPLTDAQQTIVFHLMEEVCRLMQSAEYALKAAGVTGFDQIDIVENAIASVAEHGSRDTLEHLSEA